MQKILVLVFIPIFLFGQLKPVENLQKNAPRVWTLTNAMIHTTPGDFIKSGSIVIRNGKIAVSYTHLTLPTTMWV